MPNYTSTLKGPMARREFLTTMGAAAVGASLCSGCALFLVRVEPDISWKTKEGALILDRTATEKLSSPGSKLRAVSPDGDRRIIVFRALAGDLHAIDMECTHLGSDVDYNPEATELQCPSHGSRFNLQGEVVEGPADDNLKQYAVEEREYEIRVLL